MTIKYGIIGSGRMGQHHAQQLKNIPEAQIVAVCDKDEQTATNLGTLTGSKIYTDYHELLEKEELDAVYLCTPVKGRVEQVKAITEKGVHLYIEKPLASSVEEGEQIMQFVSDSSIMCTVGFQWRYMDITKKAKKFIEDDPISLVAGRYYWTVPLVKWIQNRENGGGQVFDQNIHMFDLAMYLNGEVEHLYSAYTQKATENEMNNWDSYSSTLTFKNKTIGNFYSTYALFPEIDEKPFLDIIQRNQLIRITEGKLIVKKPGENRVINTQEKVGGINTDFHEAIWKKDPSKILAPIEV